MRQHAIVADVARYYETKLAAHGPTPAGVDWNSAASQALRFSQFLPLFDGAPEASVNDYGCGYGAFLHYLRGRGHTGAYVGFDASAAMTQAARQVSPEDGGARFVSDRSALGLADVTVASGIFNVRLDASDDAWGEHVLETVQDLASVSARGFAFNALTVYSDADKRRADLYYCDPLMLFDHCRRTFSRRVALLHDYPLYEFTILVRL